MTDQITSKGKARLAVAAAIILAVAIVAGGLAANSTAKNQRAKLIGPKDASRPTCPTPKEGPDYKDCNAFGHATGFQLSTTKQKRAVHKIREDGHIVAWGVDLGVPDPEARSFFEANLGDDTFGKYGSNPVGNISILKKKKGSNRNDRFTLTKQSPIVELESQLGRSPIITLDKPLKVKKGLIVGFSTPTWATNFGLQERGKKRGLSSSNRWRASRESNRCEPEDKNKDGDFNDPGEIDNLTKRSKPQYKKGSTRTYGCAYGNAQIIYWAYFVPDKGGGGKGGN
jgi:hypothetical protein